MAPPCRVLFIGNSLTSFGPNSLDLIFKQWGFDAEVKATMGATLSEIWNQGGWQRTIEAGSYDAVCIQEDLPEYSRCGLKSKQEHWRELFEASRSAVSGFVAAINVRLFFQPTAGLVASPAADSECRPIESFVATRPAGGWCNANRVHGASVCEVGKDAARRRVCGAHAV